MKRARFAQRGRAKRAAFSPAFLLSLAEQLRRSPRSRAARQLAPDWHRTYGERY
jgi:hypothetical protein